MLTTERASAVDVHIRQAAFSDYDQIAAVMARNGLTPRPRASWIALWRGNPAFDPAAQAPVAWVLEAENRLAGCVAGVPRNYVFGGERIRAIAECDWAVDKRYRSYALALWQRLARRNDVELLLSTTVSAASEPAYSAYHWSRAPVGQWDQAGFWVTGYGGFLRSALRRREVPLAAGLAYPLGAALWCRDRLLYDGEDRSLTMAARKIFTSRDAAARKKRCAVEWRADFDSGFDLFWQDLQQEKKDVLLAARDAATLAWHYQPGQARQNAWIVTASQGSRLRAYAIFVRRDQQRLGLRRMRLADFQALEEGAEAFQAILDRAIARCKAEGIHMLEDVGCFSDRLGFPAPHRRKLEAWAFYYKALSAGLIGTLADPARCDPTAFEGDLSL
ncbi:MAG TPA: hypothetical protein VKV17_18710 [Bryobacteraceae bacterium]|nr:hypothetical protein [Bryobacteraceae bacterium]